MAQWSCTATAAGGPTTVRLWHPSPVWDVFARQKVGGDLTEFTVGLFPSSTALYHLGDRDLMGE